MAARWRRWFRAVHRDLGYAVAALLLAYSISGLAVNHIEDWNPNYTFHERAVDVGPLPSGDYQAMETHIVRALELNPQRVKGHFQDTETSFRVFLKDAEEVRVKIATGKGTFKHIATRPGLYEINALHLNSIKGVWTWVADIFAILLIVLIVTGIFMMKGARGITGRGKWFLAGGFLVPAAFIAFLVLGL